MDRRPFSDSPVANGSNRGQLEEKFVTPQEYEKLLLSRKKLYRILSSDANHRGVMDPATGARIFPTRELLPV